MLCPLEEAEAGMDFQCPLFSWLLSYANLDVLAQSLFSCCNREKRQDCEGGPDLHTTVTNLLHSTSAAASVPKLQPLTC